mgnify:CR=1 FL=1
MKIQTENFERVNHPDGGFIFRFRTGRGPAGNISREHRSEKKNNYWIGTPTGRYIIEDILPGDSGWSLIRALSSAEAEEFQKLL